MKRKISRSRRRPTPIPIWMKTKTEMKAVKFSLMSKKVKTIKLLTKTKVAATKTWKAKKTMSTRKKKKIVKESIQQKIVHWQTTSSSFNNRKTG